MPKLLKFECNKCKYSLRTWHGGVIYATDDDGKRHTCPHPGEAFEIAKVLNISESEIMGFPYLRIPNPDLYPLLNERVGVLTDCLCLECLGVFKIDWKVDTHICPKCASEDVIPVDHLGSVKCPKCKEGIMCYIDTGIIS
ncbi:MAG: hypothetical protein GF364_02690 [Candidatus Lokiarchaeota archaeon]|nr:hypothetical protein [Candidatus Lokiarchaeota archaeon]